MGHDERKVHGTRCPLEENVNSIHWGLNSTPERLKKKKKNKHMCQEGV